MKNSETKKGTTMKTGTAVKTYAGSFGVIEYQTADGRYAVREANGRLDLWQWWQVEAV